MRTPSALLFSVPLILLVGCGDNGDGEPLPSGTDTSFFADLGPTGGDAGTITDMGATSTDAGADAGTSDLGPVDAGAIDPVAEPYRTVRSSGLPAERMDIVVVGDGYTVDELGTAYARDVSRLTSWMFGRQSLGASEPFYYLRNLFNVHRVHLASAASGIDDSAAGVMVDTALDGTDNCAGLGSVCYVDTAKALTAVTTALEGASIVPDLIVVVLNSDKTIEHASITTDGRFAVYAGGGASGNPDQVGDRGLRQLARALAGLAQNDTGTGAYSGTEPLEANLTASSTGAKWSAWIGDDFANDMQSAVSAYEGGGGYATGVYRPVSSSKLTGELEAPFDPVAREAIVQAVFSVVPAIVSHTAAGSVLTDPEVIDATTASASLVTLSWYVDGMAATSQGTAVTGDRFGFKGWAQSEGLAAGVYTVEARPSVTTTFRFPNCRRCRSATIPLVKTVTPEMTTGVTWQVELTQ